ncbi:hypothetical protein LTR04_005217 [Oleoguttula sp. CCFEE 6159]|nr:hypothetical protein LTR04_005217 [Oleoguttula sp. CCFEE 6159]
MTATLAHCAYCFESLSASLERRPAPSLRRVEELWEKYNAAVNTDGADGEGEADDDDAEMTDAEAGPPARRGTGPHRLAAPSSASASSSSSSSLSIPCSSSSFSSSRSTPSSSRADASTPATSKSSSRTSLFSLSRSIATKPAPSSASEERPLFVTWNTVSRSGTKTLRGCIGTFEPQQLEHGLRGYALTSAFDDSRFPPIPASALPTLSVSITLLHSFTPCPDPLAWTLGTHGLRLSFTHRGRRLGATYLPDVPREQSWSREEAIVSLMRKAGWGGRREEWRAVLEGGGVSGAGGGGGLVTYKGSSAALGYAEWRAWKDWVDRQGLSLRR